MRNLREARDLTQQELSDRVGCSVVTIRKLEAGARRPSKHMAELLARQLGVPAAERAAFLELARAAPRAEPAPSLTPHNLPLVSTPLIGREAEVQQVLERLRLADTRVLTLIGPGGVGKTRLALAVAQAALPFFPEGVTFVPLASLTDSDLVLPAIVTALGLPLADDALPAALSVLKTTLAGQVRLLVLDNFEQVRRAAFFVAELLAACPQVKVLVTSREALLVRPEHIFLVPPLSVPASRAADTSPAAYSALALFAERAQAVRPGFTLTPENLPAVIELCARLDGLPLAIELVAARIKLMPPQHLLGRLLDAEGRLQIELVAEADPHRPERHSALRRAIGWSYALLNAEEQTLFRALAVFAGGCGLEAAEAIGGPGASATRAVWNGLASLIDKSLLQQHELQAEIRFSLLETVREFAWEKLQAGQERALVEGRHAAFYLTLAETAEPHLREADQAVWLERLEREHDNLRAALRWALASGQADTAGRLVGALQRFWGLRGHLQEGRRWSEAALNSAGRMERAVQTRALYAAGALAFRQNDLAAAQGFISESLALSRDLGDEAQVILKLHTLGTILLQLGDFEQATRLYSECLGRDRARGDVEGIAYDLGSLGDVALRQGHYAQAQTYLEESLALHRRRGEKSSIAITLNNLGETLRARGQRGRATLVFEEAVEALRELGHLQTLATVLANLAELRAGEGEVATARSLYREALLLQQQLNVRAELAFTLSGFADLALKAGQPERAVQLYAACVAMHAAAQFAPAVEHSQKVEAALEVARAQLREAGYARAWAAGQALTLESAIRLALEVN